MFVEKLKFISYNSTLPCKLYTDYLITYCIIFLIGASEFQAQRRTKGKNK